MLDPVLRFRSASVPVIFPFGSRPLPGPVAEALRLRRWTLRVLAGDHVGTAPSLPPASPDGLRLFLTVERCALPLLRRLGGVPSPEAPPEWLLVGLRERAAGELKRVLSARAQLVEIARVVEERGWSCTVLKGGVAVVGGGEEVDVADLDLLLSRAEAEALALWLEERGYRSDHVDAPEGSAGVRHLAPRVRGGAIQVELHHMLRLEGDVPADARVPLGAIPGLRRLAPPEHLRHLLEHGVIQHPERRGNIRDLLLVSASLRECAPDEVAGVRRWIDASLAPAAMHRMLESATGLARGEAPHDPFDSVAAANYLIHYAGAGLRLPAWLGRSTRIAAVSLAGGRGAYRTLWKGTPASVLTPPSWRGPTRLDLRAPRVAWLARTVVRAGRLITATALGWGLARRARAGAVGAMEPPSG